MDQLIFRANKRSIDFHEFAFMNSSLPSEDDEVVEGNDSYGTLDGNGPEGIIYDGYPDGILDGNDLAEILDGNYLEGILDGNDPT